MNIGLHLRPATQEDLAAVAHLHVKAWRQAYAPLLPQEIIEAIDVDERLKMWQEDFGKDGSSLIMACMGDKPIGFAAFGPARDTGAKGWGEIYAIYLLRESCGKGVGFALFKKAKEELLKGGFDRIYLWTLSTNNRAIAAYERWGGLVDLDARKEEQIADCAIKEVLVRFDIMSIRE
ncbi:MAG: GNAT family N-acetyltransferase [Alphaproteobacteria bacterium]|nr:GNAT family N-acetyltransferase [Alphaproteobacteria bacterium]